MIKIGRILPVVAVLYWYSIHVVGMLIPAEIVLAGLFLLTRGKGRLLQQPIPKRILFFGMLWLFSQLLTDVVRHSSSENLLKGAASTMFFLSDFAALYLLLASSERRVAMFSWAMAVGGILQFFIAPTEYAQGQPWKWAIGPAVTVMFFLLLGRVRRGSVALGSCFLLAVFDLFMNFRSLAGFTLLTGALLYVAWSPLLVRALVSKKGLLVLPAVAFGLGVGILLAYQWAAESRLLPEDVTRKYEMDKSSTLGLAGLIIGGRIEWVASVPAVLDSPILGHGSWAADRRYAQMLLLVNAELGMNRNEAGLEYDIEQSDLIPTHSHLMQAWVWAGVLGAVFWLVVLAYVLHLLRDALSRRSSLQPLAIFLGIGLVWAIFFSPFGYTVRIQEAQALVVLIVAAGAFKVKSREGRKAPRSERAAGGNSQMPTGAWDLRGADLAENPAASSLRALQDSSGNGFGK